MTLLHEARLYVPHDIYHGDKDGQDQRPHHQTYQAEQLDSAKDAEKYHEQGHSHTALNENGSEHTIDHAYAQKAHDGKDKPI